MPNPFFFFFGGVVCLCGGFCSFFLLSWRCVCVWSGGGGGVVGCLYVCV